MGYTIVIDASVARAAGESGKPEPSACRATLLAMLTHNHKVAMSVSLRGEWRSRDQIRTLPMRPPLPYAG